MTERNFYQVLGVGRSASPDDIRAAYIRLVKRHHPDVVGYLPSRLRDVQQAYRCLSNSETRETHDRALAQDERAHLARQRSIQRRLGRYDHRHPRPLPRTRRWRWPKLAVAAAGIVLAIRLSLTLYG
ncbi:DnaJ domain-containing protein [Sphingomonas gellani]|uniref:DnaJ domain-containing protein n=1 Tax=Sphingomonas gellani TaxID=1166340 RepID=A0A1H8I2X9_9SPHN|nr:DnaJ domain-containing protein [Sphingomonas gellani]SEN62691.1 DnaJ domain-containing protein [Sphingomonas gellani]